MKDRPVRKKTILVPDRAYIMAAQGALPKRPVSVSQAPWEDQDGILDGHADHIRDGGDGG